jgi:hypothetical protein
MSVNIVPLLALVIIDICGWNTLWKERFDRRILHHLSNGYYSKKRTPNIFVLKSLLGEDILKAVIELPFPEIKNSINSVSFLLSRLLSGHYSKRSSLYYNDLHPEVIAPLEEIALRVKPYYENIINKRLELNESNFRVCLLRYEGDDANFAFHYDSDPGNCYRSLILIRAKGIIPPFCYYDQDSEKRRIHLSLGDSIFFQGTKTYHGVERSHDPNTSRWVLGFQYKEADTLYPAELPSLCNQLRGKSSFSVVLTLLPNFTFVVVMLFFSSFLYPPQMVSSVLITILSLFAFVVSVIFSHHCPSSMGTGYHPNFQILLTFSSLCSFYFCLATMNILDASLLGFCYCNYILTTDVFLPRDLVRKHIQHG